MNRINLSHKAAERCYDHAVAVWENKYRLDPANHPREEREDWITTNFIGYKGEFAFALFLGIPYTFTLYAGPDPGYDFVINNQTVDVKTLQALKGKNEGKGYLLFNTLEDVKAARLVLVHHHLDYPLTFDIVGWTTREIFITPGNHFRANLLKRPDTNRYCMRPDQLFPMASFFDPLYGVETTESALCFLAAA